MAKVMNELDLLTKHVIGAPSKLVNVTASVGFKSYDDYEAKTPDEKIRFLVN